MKNIHFFIIHSIVISVFISLSPLFLQAQILNAYDYYDKFSEAGCAIMQPGALFVYCINIPTWSQLLVSLNKTANLTEITEVRIKPEPALLLTDELNLWTVCNIVCRNQPLFCRYVLTVRFSGLKGVDVLGGGNWMKDKKNCSSIFSLYIESSTMTFYMAGQAPGQYNCSSETQFSLENGKKFTTTGMFFNSYYDEIYFDKSVLFDQQTPVCPFVFAYARLDDLIINSLVDSFIASNLLKFQKVLSTKSINSSINQLELHGYNFKLDESLMHPLVFEHVQELYLSGSVCAFQNDGLMYAFKNLDTISINVASLTNFFHQVGVEWTRRLPNNTWLIFMDSPRFLYMPEWLSHVHEYTYPDRDLCLFASMPLQNKSGPTVLPLLSTGELKVCTDTAAWLTQNYHLYKIIGNYDIPILAVKVYSLCWINNTKKVNLTLIEGKIDQCLSASSWQGQLYSENWDYYTVVYMIQLAVDVLTFILIPLASIVGLLLNLRVVWTVHKNSEVELKEEFYRYMSLNSTFNCLFCLIYTLYPINYCQQYETGYFCSTISKTMPAQIIKIVFIGFFGETLKMCANISYIFITINRYMLIGKKHNKTLSSISHFNFKKVVFVTVIFSLLLNVGHCFQYRINQGWGVLVSEGHITLTYDIYPSIVNQNSAFNVYTIVYFVINFAVFFVLNTIVEASLVRNLHTEIRDKRVKADNEIQLSQSRNSSGSEVINKVNSAKKKKIEQDAKKETRAIVMVITNSGLNFFLRLPEIFVFFSSNFAYLDNSLSGLHDSVVFEPVIINDFDNIMVSVSYFLYILTFTANVAVYWMFNPKFKQHFSLWKSNVRIK
jgi:hypothetical protein